MTNRNHELFKTPFTLPHKPRKYLFSVAPLVALLCTAFPHSLLAQTLTGSSLNVYGAPSVPTCPVDACPPAGSPQATSSVMQEYGVSTHDTNWEIGAVMGLLDTTGAGSGQANDHTNGAKMGAYIGLMQTKTGGPGWALNTNIVRNAVPGGPSSLPGFAGSGMIGEPGAMNVYSSTIGYELDLSNFDRDANGLPPASPFVVGMYLTTTSTFPSWAGILYGIGQGQKSDAWHNGLLFSGPNASGGGRTVSDNTIWDNSNSDVGYHSQGLHARAGWYDESQGNYGIWITGTKKVEDIDLTTATPVGLAVNGQRANDGAGIHLNVTAAPGQSNSGVMDTGNHGNGQAFDDRSTSAVAFKAEGTNSYAAFSAQQANTKIALTAARNQEVCFNNSDNCVTWDGNTLVYSQGPQRLFAIDNKGNLSIRGKLTENGQP